MLSLRLPPRRKKVPEMQEDVEWPILLLPHHPAGRLTGMAHLALIPWKPHDGFTVDELGQRLRHHGETEQWLAQWHLTLVPTKTDEWGQWYELRTEATV